MPKRKNALIEIDRIGRGDLLQMRALVNNDYKLVYYPVLQETILFDRKNDPGEQKNLADEPEHQTLVQQMLKDLLSELARTEMPEIR
jgi:arylsulfatase A-like enzyme